MTTIGKAIRALLLSESAVTSLLGTSTAIFPNVLEQNTATPAVTYQVVSGDSVRHLSGSDNLGYQDVQISCFAATEPAAVQLGEAIRVELENYRGTSDGVVIERIRAGNLFTDVQENRVSSDEHRYVAIRTYQCWHTEPAINN